MPERYAISATEIKKYRGRAKKRTKPNRGRTEGSRALVPKRQELSVHMLLGIAQK